MNTNNHNSPSQSRFRRSSGAFKGLLGGMLLAASASQGLAQIDDGLISYWPLDVVQGTKTPDLISFYDMELVNLTSDDLVDGKHGKAFSFSNERQTLLQRVHEPSDNLPANKHESYTLSMWVNVTGEGQNDLRIFSEGNTSNSNPLFNMGTHNGGADGSLDFYLRQSGWDTFGHAYSEQQPFDSTWHHIALVQSDGARTFYVDGVADALEIPDKPEGDWLVNNTSIGGILRAAASHWVTGLIDDVAIWNRALTESELGELSSSALGDLLGGQEADPVAEGLVAHWPLDVIQGTKTPDKVNGYDMELTNLSESDVVAGKVGNAFSFSNERQTLLSRVHEADEDLPANKHESYTLSMWVNVVGEGQNDLRIFSEGNTSNSNPLFNLGTHNGGADGSLDFYLRQSGWDTFGHAYSEQQPFDGTWRHIAFVQTNGARTLYVDGVADALEIPDKPEGDWLVNNSSIGGILRAAASHWSTGLIDEVAVWKRALSEDEVNSVITNGVPSAGGGNQRPLAIASFSAEYASAAKGSTVVLQWDASPDASLWVSHGVGDVTANSEFGVGTVSVPLEGTSNFTLYASRGSDTVSASTMVTAYDGIADGWTLIQDFESMNTDASVNGQERWKNPEGTTAVIETGTPSGNAMTLSGTALSAVLLGSQTILEGEKATLFFRAYTAEGDGGSVQVNVGLSEKPIRFIGDFDADVGPFVQFGDLEGFLDLLSIDGYGGTLDWTGKSVDYETTYNVWLDVDNRNLDDGDKFTMYFQKASGGDREEGFKDYTSDRNPAGSVDLGLPGPDLDTIFVSSHNNGIQEGQFLIDDIYISKGSFNDGIPAEIGGLNATDEITDDSTPPGGGGTGEPAAAAMVASSDGALSAPAVVDFGALDGSASFEFHFTAIKAGASTAIAGNDAFAIKLDQWNEQGVFGTTEFGVADNLFTAVEGGSVNSVFDAPVHVVIVSDTAAGESHLYIDGALSGTWAGNIPFSGDTKVMGARLEQATDHMGEGSVMHSWATYSGLLTAAEITSKFEALPDVSGGGGDAMVAILSLDGVADAGSGLDGRYWQAAPKAVSNLQDKGEATDIGLHIINNYYPTGTFTATGLDFQGGNDLTPIQEWLQGDGESYVGADGNMDDGILSFTGYIRIDNPGEIAIRSASDDGSVIWIAGQKVVDNDGGHGAPGPSPDGSYNFEEAGLYPIEIAYYNGDWTNDAGDHGGANLGITANGDPIPGAILYSASDIGATAIAASSIASGAGDAGLHGAYWTTEPKGAQFGEDSQGPIFQNVPGDDHGLALFGTAPQGRFVATTMTYTGNDLTPILEWLGDDSGSFIGAEGNLDDGIFQFTGFLNVPEAGQHAFRSSSDDGSVVRIGNQIVVNNDGGHGAPGPAPDGNAFFPVAGLYPIEVAYFNGDWTNDGGDHGGANIELTMNGESIAGHLLQPLGGLPSIGFSSILLDFGGTEGSGAGASPSPWVTIDSLTQDEPVDLGGGVTLTALDDGYTANNPAPPNEGAEYAGIMVPQEARNDYLFKNTDTAGTEARMQITGLPAGTYDVTVFEGRTTDASQFAKIWAGDGNEPDAENTGTFAGDHATVTVTVGEGETLWYKHLEDNSGGISGMIIQMAGGSAGGISAVTLQDGNITIEYTGTLKSSATVNGEFSAVDGASSPYSVAADQNQAFFIAD
ncbi:PA14 domain-containing protein [Verrucomicrobia bacterium]|nr:PA14 domain-containing protein [Verrucomicrobiota bacterium]